jgi:hypothetical protein
MTQEIDIDALERLLKMATPGPWTLDERYIVAGGAGEVPGAAAFGEIIGSMTGIGHLADDAQREQAERDASAVVAAVNAAINLIERVRKLETVREAARRSSTAWKHRGKAKDPNGHLSSRENLSPLSKHWRQSGRKAS